MAWHPTGSHWAPAPYGLEFPGQEASGKGGQRRRGARGRERQRGLSSDAGQVLLSPKTWRGPLSSGSLRSLALEEKQDWVIASILPAYLRHPGAGAGGSVHSYIPRSSIVPT